MKGEVLFLGVLMGLGLLAGLLWRRNPAPWLKHMRYLHAGLAHRAEWMAPPPILQNIRYDYLAFYIYAAETLPKGWRAYLHDLDSYLTDEMLQQQRESLSQQQQGSAEHFYGILRAIHRIEVRHFSPDGLSCVVIDYQTERRMATYDRQHGRRRYTQDLGAAALVYEMRYDRRSQNWKIARYIQTLPLGIRQFTTLNIHEPLQRPKL